MLLVLNVPIIPMVLLKGNLIPPRSQRVEHRNMRMCCLITRTRMLSNPCELLCASCMLRTYIHRVKGT